MNKEMQMAEASDTPLVTASLTGEVVRSSTPAGVVAAATHFGPYQGLGAAHAAIHAWCAAHGHELAGPNWEIYGHWQPEWNADPSRIHTDVCYLVEPTNHPSPAGK